MNFADYTSIEIENHLNEEKIAIIPLGAVEAHGAHLPLGIDNDLSVAYAERLGNELDALVLPNIPYGQVWSLRDFPGSITLSDETVSSILYEITESLYKQGIRFTVFFSAHLGNMTAMKKASRQLYDDFPDLKTVYLFYPNLQKYADEVREGGKAHGAYVHADEIETSLAMYLVEDKVNREELINESPDISITADYTPTPWEEFTETAVLGDATLASEKKGEFMIQNTIEDAVKIIKEIQNK